MPTIEEVHAELTAPGAPFEMAEARVRGTPIRYWKNVPPDLRAVLTASAAHGERTFIVYRNERLSFADHFAATARLARALRDDFAVQPGDRVAIAMRNLPEWSIAFWAIVASGAVAVPLNAWWTADELGYALADSGARLLFADEERVTRVRASAKGIEASECRLIGVRCSAPRSDVTPFDALVAPTSTATPSLPAVEIAPDDHATLFYTSGTTGRPKGVIGSHRNMCTNLGSVGFARARSLLRSGVSRETVAQLEEAPAFLLSVPLFHVTGSHSTLLSTLALGAKLVLMHKWDPEQALELIERERITIFGGVPTMVLQVLDSPALAERDTSSLRSVRYGGAPSPPELVRRIDALLPGRTPSNGYGMTETSAIASSNAGADYRERPTSVGVPMAVCDVRIVDDTGADLPTGAVGELWIRGPNVALGYWNQPEASEATFGGGWLRTGDLARRDEEGFLYIVDRAKDVVIRGGENVYCVQVEAVLFEHPDVVDAAVVGLPHPTLGEEVAAVVVTRDGTSLDAESLRERIRARLAAFNVPSRFWLRSEPLPRNAAGKVLKKQVQQQFDERTSEAAP